MSSRKKQDNPFKFTWCDYVKIAVYGVVAGITVWLLFALYSFLVWGG